MSKYKPIFYQSVEKCVDEVIKRVGKNIVLGMPLGLGKANHVANEIYRRVKEDSGMNLTIITALSLERPTPASELERSFLARKFHKPDRFWLKAFQPEAVVIYLVPAKLKERRRMQRLNNAVPGPIRKARLVRSKLAERRLKGET